MNSIILRDPINEQPLVDLMGTLPVDAARIILRDLKDYLPDVALVCSRWRDLVDDDDFRNMIRPTIAFGSREWKYYIGVDAGREPRLPRCAYRGDIESGKYLLTLVPKTVKLILKNKYAVVINLNNLKVIEKLLANAINGNKVVITEDSPQKEILNSKRKLENSHWVLLDKEVRCKNETYDAQQEIAKEVNIKAPDTKISGLIDTVISVCMDYIRSRMPHSFLDPVPPDYQSIFIRFNELYNGKKIRLFFRWSGIRIQQDTSPPNLPEGVGFLWAKKSFGQLEFTPDIRQVKPGIATKSRV